MFRPFYRCTVVIKNVNDDPCTEIQTIYYKCVLATHKICFNVTACYDASSSSHTIGILNSTHQMKKIEAISPLVNYKHITVL